MCKRVRKRKGFEKILLCLSAFVLFAGLFKTAHAVGTVGSISGHVIDKSSGKPIGKVLVTLSGAGGTYTAETDSNGFYVIAAVSAGTYSIQLKREGYQSVTYEQVVVAADASTPLDAQLSVEVYKVQGLTVTAYRDATTNPRQVVPNYGYSDELVKELFAGPLNLRIPGIYQSLPGVVPATDPYFGTAAHIRGGTGNDIGYAFDGVPVHETMTGTATFSTTYANIGTTRTDFFVGSYPVGYGNFPSGYVNQVVHRGNGEPHGSIEFQYGFWLDEGQRLPSINHVTGNVSAYNGQQFPNPFNYNFTFSGQDQKFHYFVNQIGMNGCQGCPLITGVDLKPFLQFGTYRVADFDLFMRDTVMNLNYDLSRNDDLQLLLEETEQTTDYFGLNPTATALIPFPDESEVRKNDLEKFEWHHRFNKPGESLMFRLWRYSPDERWNQYDVRSVLNAWRESWESGTQLEYQNQLSPQNQITIGGMYYYSRNLYWFGFDVPNGAGPYFSQLLGPIGARVLAKTPFGVNGYGVPDTQTMAGWIWDEWHPTPKITISAGLRWDRQNYLIPGKSQITLPETLDPTDPSAPYILNGDIVTNNGLPFSLPGCNSTPGVSSFCFDPGMLHPSFVLPRGGVSYRISDQLTAKASYGKFLNFAPGRVVALIEPIATSVFPTPALQSLLGNKPAVYMAPGSRPEFSESMDFSLEYSLNDHTYLKATPYVKHIVNPLISVQLPNGVLFTTNAGGISSTGVEVLLKTEDWKGLTGWLAYTYSGTRGSEFPVSTLSGVMASRAGVPNPLPASVLLADAQQVLPAPYDIPHVLSMVANYKVPGTGLEVAPQLFWQDGQAYGLGFDNLCALYAVENGIPNISPSQCASIPGFNPLHETTADSLRAGSFLTGNLSLTNHFNKNVSAILTITNLWNTHQTYAPLTQSFLFTPVEKYPFKPTYDPLQGQYYNLLIPSLRQFTLTFHYNY